MDRLKQYKFINSETGNVIYFLSLPENSESIEADLESTRAKIAAENNMFLGAIYYVCDDEYE